MLYSSIYSPIKKPYITNSLHLTSFRFRKLFAQHWMLIFLYDHEQLHIYQLGVVLVGLSTQ